MTVESNTHKCVSVFFGLPFVPLENVNETSEYIAENAEENLDDLVDYSMFVEYVAGAEDQKLQNFHQKLVMFIYQY